MNNRLLIAPRFELQSISSSISQQIIPHQSYLRQDTPSAMQQPTHPRNASVNDNNYDKHQDDDVSDISEEDDFLPGEGHHNVASMKKYRVFWTQAKEEFLLRCYNHYRITSSSDHGLKGKSWRRIAVRMGEEFREEYDSKSCRNKMNVLRADYANYKAILEARSQGKDDDEFWNQMNNKSARAVKWKDQEFPYYDTLRRILEENGGKSFDLFVAVSRLSDVV